LFRRVDFKKRERERDSRKLHRFPTCSDRKGRKDAILLVLVPGVGLETFSGGMIP
jgi:hypothetical protein